MKGIHIMITNLDCRLVRNGTSVALSTKTYFWGDVIVLRCVGRLVAGKETTAFREGVEKLLAERHRVIINLTEVDHIDSAGLAALVHLSTQKRDPEGGASLVSSRMRLTELLRRTKLDTVIIVYASEEEAVALFPKQRSSSPDSQSSPPPAVSSAKPIP
jgi:anti-anti-sigma factor